MTDPQTFALTSSAIGVASIFLALLVRKIRKEDDRKAQAQRDAEAFFAAEARRAK